MNASNVKKYVQSITNGEKDALLGSAFRDRDFHKKDPLMLFDELPADFRRLMNDMFTLAQRFKELELKYKL